MVGGGKYGTGQPPLINIFLKKMKNIMKTKYPFICFAIILIFSIDAMAHSGRTNKNGGHNDYKHGGYHNHNGGNNGSNSSYGSSGSSYQHYSSQLEPSLVLPKYIPYIPYIPITYKCNGVVVTMNEFYNCAANSKNSNKVQEEKLKVDINDDKILLDSGKFSLNSCMISGILDADIIQSSGKNSKKIILYGIDAPEEGQPFHDEAENMLRKLTHNKKITTKIYFKSKDGVDSAVIFVGGKNVNELMVESGYAWVYRDSCSE